MYRLNGLNELSIESVCIVLDFFFYFFYSLCFYIFGTVAKATTVACCGQAASNYRVLFTFLPPLVCGFFIFIIGDGVNY